MYSPLAGVRVWLDTARGPITAHTNVEGRFRLDAVPPGRHALNADLGPGEEAREEIVELRSIDDCATAFVSARPSGRLTGQVVDASGRPLSELRVYAIPTTHDWSRRDLSDTGSSETDRDGRFTFRGLKPGGYVVGVNVFDEPLVKRPYRPVYYPGVDSRSQAATIDIGQGRSAPLEPLVLRKPLPQTALTAEIVCRDGTRPASASIEARIVGEHNFFAERTHEQTGGRFVIPDLAGYKYEVKGSVMVQVKSDEGTGISSRPTAGQIVDSASPPPLLKFVSTLERCDTPGGPVIVR